MADSWATFVFGLVGVCWKYRTMKRAIDAYRMPLHRIKRIQAIQTEERKRKLIISVWTFVVWLLLAIGAILDNSYFYLPWKYTQLLLCVFTICTIIFNMYQLKVLECMDGFVNLMGPLFSLIIGEQIWYMLGKDETY